MTRVIRIKSLFGNLNTFLLIDKKVIIVDTGYKNHYKKILNYLEKNKINKEQVSLIILTHAHLDHYDNANIIKNKFKVSVLASKAAAKHLENGDNEPTMPTNLLAKIIKFFYNHKKNTPISPDIIIEQRFDLSQFGIGGFVLPTPGHTKGSLAIIVNNNEVLAGDLFFKKGEASAWFVDNLEEYKKSINKLKSLNIKKVYPSHGKEFFLE
jgi:hydroxyacylglutathione hydrolase